MKQYIDLLRTIADKGTYKPAAREGMPSSLSLFGYQNRYNLADGFPILTTKKIHWKSVVTELLWFLGGDTNIKYLVDNGCNIWNEDAYNYYQKNCKENNTSGMSFNQFVELMKNPPADVKQGIPWFTQGTYKLGDCGFQYGKVWRRWEQEIIDTDIYAEHKVRIVDQIKNVIKSLRKSPESRRHIVTAIDPVHDQDLALYWCHAMFQFNCRPVKLGVEDMADEDYSLVMDMDPDEYTEFYNKKLEGKPKFYLDCHLYQRSADAILGVPFNISSYCLLIHIIAKIVNMVPGEFIHSFGDVHIYANHKEACEEQLKRKPGKLPTLEIAKHNWDLIAESCDFTGLEFSDFVLHDYNPQPAIKAELSTGLKK